ncbi:hypothetical protein SSX86_022398 [Deinandra increscens subsp. villosa]|uniref:Omega-3 fatty acid desaturase n=1 Tax=Deinandra increscens subsp. villosa TaxID=3103831 RepID=A0AAP0CP56_9ASTR
MAVSSTKNQFDLSAPPPFKLGDVRAAIPDHCWVRNPWRSLSYVLKDILVISSLVAIALFFKNSLWVWPLYWVAQGTMFWAIFVLGHDCGHGSFSDNHILNSIVGHILHSSILVPYHGWRISHRIHHQYHGHVENDESFVPLTEKAYKTLDAPIKLLRYKIPFPLFVYPIYLWTRTAGKAGSHYNPYSDIFAPNERRYVVTSSFCWALMVANLIYLSTIIGPNLLFKLYGVPYIIYVMWLDFVVYLQHHGHEEKLPWYRGEEWSYLRGGLTTVDRDYGIFNSIHHDVGTHVIHHLFPQIPHYHLVEATKAAKPVLGRYYREPKRSGPIPVHLISNWVRSIKQDNYVSDVGDVVFYQTDDRKKI